jgi:hypothetical protein
LDFGRVQAQFDKRIPTPKREGVSENDIDFSLFTGLFFDFPAMK